MQWQQNKSKCLVCLFLTKQCLFFISSLKKNFVYVTVVPEYSAMEVVLDVGL